MLCRELRLRLRRLLNLIMDNNFDGYKAFNADFSNCIGERCQENTEYEFLGDVVERKSGFHFCKRLEDVFKYYNGLNKDIIICRVKALSDVIWYSDEDYFYGDYDDIGVCSKIYIGNAMTRDEIMSYVLNLNFYSLMRFIRGYKLSVEEIECLKDKINNEYKDYCYRDAVLNCISYYQEDNKDVYTKKLER